MLWNVLETGITPVGFIACILAAMAGGMIGAIVFDYRRTGENSWKIAIALLPAVVAAIIMMVNGNLGTGIAVAGTFAVTRFRSAPGTAKEIAGMFFAVSIGLICGMGYLVIAAMYIFIYSVFVIMLTGIRFGETDSGVRLLRITVPENLDYEDEFEEVLQGYTKSFRQTRVKTTNMGALYVISYEVVLKNDKDSKKLIDELRCRNGNLSIVLGRPVVE